MSEISINSVEAVWLALNMTTLALTISAFVDARADSKAVKLLNGHARELTASGLVRREGFRVIVQLLLLSIVVPGLFSDREIVLSPILVILMAIPVILLTSSLLDARDRRALTVMTTAEVAGERLDAFERLETLGAELVRMVGENTTISQGARDDAHEAAAAANSVNEKIKAQGDQIVELTEDRGEAAGRIEATVDTTAEQVSEIHEATVHEAEA